MPDTLASHTALESDRHPTFLSTDGEGEFLQNASQGGVAWHTFFTFFTFLSFSMVSQSQKLFQWCQMSIGPPFDFGEGGEIGQESEKDDGQDGSKGLGHTTFGTGIRNFLRHWTKMSRELGWDMMTSLSCKGKAKKHIFIRNTMESPPQDEIFEKISSVKLEDGLGARKPYVVFQACFILVTNIKWPRFVFSVYQFTLQPAK